MKYYLCNTFGWGALEMIFPSSGLREGEKTQCQMPWAPLLLDWEIGCVMQRAQGL